MKKERIEWIDQVRGFAILLVVLGHVIGGLDQIGGGIENEVRMAIYSFHMPLFFMVSGLLAKDLSRLSAKESRKYVIKQIIALYVPYLIWGYIFWLVKYFIYSGNEQTTLVEGLRIPIDRSAWIPGWFLLALLVIRIIDLIIDKTCLASPVFQIAMWSIICVIGYMTHLDAISLGFRYGIYYESGKFFNARYKKEYTPVLLMLFFVGFILFDSSLINHLSEIIMAIGICFPILFIFESSDSQLSILNKFGKNSMIIYVMQAYFTIPARIILQRLHVSNLAVFVIAEMAFCIVVSYVFITIVDKCKWLRALYYPLSIKKKN